MIIRILSIYIFIFIRCITSEIINQLHIFEKTTIILDVNFKVRRENKNGCKFVSWFIDDQEVDKEQYRTKLKEYKNQELEIEFETENELVAADEQFNNDLEISILKKILKLKIQQIQDCLSKIKKLEEFDLSKFYAFSDETFLNFKEIKDVEKNVVVQANRYVEKSNDKIDASDVNLYIDKLSQYPDKLNNFFKNTLNNSIKVSDDTKLLRQLLELVS